METPLKEVLVFCIGSSREFCSQLLLFGFIEVANSVIYI